MNNTFEFYRDETGRDEFRLGNRQLFILRLEQKALETYGKRNGNGNCGQGMRIQFPVDTARLEQAIQRVINENDALRLVIANHSDTPVPQADSFMQKIVTNYQFRLDVYDAHGETEQERLDDAVRIAKEIMNQPIDYFNELSIKLFLVRMTENDHLLVWIAHHWIGDGSTSGLVLSQVFTYYADPSAEKPETGTFIDFVNEEYAFLESDLGKKQLEYWKNEVDGYKMLDLSKAAIGEPSNGEDRVFKISMAQPEAVAQQYKTSRFNVILLGYHIGVSLLLEEPDTIIGVTSANRTNKKYFRTMGYLAHSTQHRMQISDSDRLDDLLRASIRKFSGNMANLQTSYYYDRMQFCFTYQNFVANAQSANKGITPVPIPSTRVVDQFFLLVFESEKEMTLVMVGNGSIFTEKFDESMKRYIELTAELLATDPQSTIADLKKAFQAQS